MVHLPRRVSLRSVLLEHRKGRLVRFAPHLRNPGGDSHHQGGPPFPLGYRACEPDDVVARTTHAARVEAESTPDLLEAKLPTSVFGMRSHLVAIDGLKDEIGLRQRDEDH